MRDSLRAQSFERRRRCRLYRIGDRDKSGERAVEGDEDDRRAVSPQALGLRLQRIGRDPELGEKLGIAERDATTLDRAARAFAGRRVEAGDRQQFDAALVCRR